MRLAFAFRQEFGHDVLIDLIGYRRFGHNEADEPAYTQPEMYQVIKKHPPVRELFARQLIEQGVVSEQESTELTDQVWEVLTSDHQELKERIAAAKDVRHATGEYELDRTPSPEVKTAVAAEIACSVLNDELLAVPDGFTIHPKLVRQLEQRREVFDESGDGSGIMWAHAEALAFASLLTEGIPIRLTGQDTERGTFSQRHLVLHDPKTGQEHCPIQHLPGALAPMELHNSPLSEMACLGFEYGYSQEAPETLVLWEAQFGDFANGAQVIIDQFIVSGLAKWGQTSPPDPAAPARLRGLGPRALLGPPGALPPAGRRGQHPRGQPDHAGPVLPPAAPPGPRGQAAPAGDHDPQEPAPPAAGHEPVQELSRGSLPAGAARGPRARSGAGQRLILCSGKILLRAGRRRVAGREPVAWRSAGSSCSTRSRRPRSSRWSGATRTSTRSCGSRRSRATWAPAPTCRRG